MLKAVGQRVNQPAPETFSIWKDKARGKPMAVARDLPPAAVVSRCAVRSAPGGPVALGVALRDHCAGPALNLCKLFLRRLARARRHLIQLAEIILIVRAVSRAIPAEFRLQSVCKNLMRFQRERGKLLILWWAL